MVHGPRNLEEHVCANVFFSTMSILVEYKRPRNAAEDCAVLSPGYVLVEQVLSRELSRVWKVVHLRHSRDRTRVGPTGTELDIFLMSHSTLMEMRIQNVKPIRTGTAQQRAGSSEGIPDPSMVLARTHKKSAVTGA